MERESDDDTNYNWFAKYSQQKIATWTGGLENKRTCGKHPKYSIVEIGQNTKKSPGDFRTIAVTAKKRDKYFDLAREEKKTVEHESDDCYWRSRYNHQRIGTRTGALENKRTSGNHSNNRIVEIGQNIKKSSGDFRRLAVT